MFLSSFGNQGQLSSPSDLAVDSETKRVFVADYGNKQVAVFTTEGEWVGQIGHGLLRNVWGVAVEKGGARLAVSDCKEGGGESAAVHYFAV
jgi:DNA-binding beta-propeller fold protein YncE